MGDIIYLAENGKTECKYKGIAAIVRDKQEMLSHSYKNLVDNIRDKDIIKVEIETHV